MNFNESSSDEELMQAYQNGVDGAFDLLFKRHSPRVYGFLMNQVKNRTQADDVFQATFLKLHQSRGHYDPAFLFLPWLFTVCRSVLTDYRRKLGRIREDSDSETVEHAVDSRTQSIPVSAMALDSLPDRQRVAIELRFYDDLNFEEIAERLKTSSSNVRQMISRGIKNLRELTRELTRERGD